MKERFHLSRFEISRVLAASMRKLITARARKNKRTARMLANARKDRDSLPLTKKKICTKREGKNKFHTTKRGSLNFFLILYKLIFEPLTLQS